MTKQWSEPYHSSQGVWQVVLQSDLGRRHLQDSKDSPSAGDRQDISCSPTHALLPFSQRYFFQSTAWMWIFSQLLLNPSRWDEGMDSLCPSCGHWSLLSAPEALERALWMSRHSHTEFLKSTWGSNPDLATSRSSWSLRAICLPPAPCQSLILAPAILLLPASLKSPQQLLRLRKEPFPQAETMGSPNGRVFPPSLHLAKATQIDEAWQAPHAPSQSHCRGRPALPVKAAAIF